MKRWRLLYNPGMNPSSPSPKTSARPLQQANAALQYDVTPADLPLACPMPQMALWNSHPRVYLAIEETGWAKCAYCGAEFNLRK
jgi:uncharacterized Zn-finger protein